MRLAVRAKAASTAMSRSIAGSGSSWTAHAASGATTAAGRSSHSTRRHTICFHTSGRAASEAIRARNTLIAVPVYAP